MPSPRLEAAVSLSALVAIVAAVVWACPVLAGPVAEQAQTVAGPVAWGAGGVSLVTLLGWAFSAGKLHGRIEAHERRIQAVEGCASTGPGKLAALEAAAEERAKADDARDKALRDAIAAQWQEVKSALQRLDSRLDAYSDRLHDHSSVHHGRGREAARSAMSGAVGRINSQD